MIDLEYSYVIIIIFMYFFIFLAIINMHDFVIVRDERI
jgi:hypothetical protein